MVQFNLLPDVKIEFIKTRNRMRLVMLICAIASAAALAIFVLLFLFVRVNQPKHISDLNKDIDASTKKIQNIQDIDKILTIQNQLNSLPSLHEQKIISSRLTDYLNKLTPANATISDLSVNFDENKMIIDGNADSFNTVNKFSDTIKFTKYKVNDGSDKEEKAFKDVVLESFTVETPENSPGGRSTIKYQILLNFDPTIFKIVKDDKSNGEEPIKLIIPNIISTRSNTEKPTELFAPQPVQTQVQGGR